MNQKSPFFVVEEFISPLLTEEIVDMLNMTIPDTDKEGHPIPSIRFHERAESVLYERLLPLLPTIQNYYDFTYVGTETMSFEWFPQGTKGGLRCENSQFLRNKWLRTHQRDLTGVLFLSDYQETVPFEEYYEVYGGKLEFPQHHFGFNPQRGTLVIFPSVPHFINITSPVFVGDLFQVRFHIAATIPFLYNPNKFPGNYTTWFKPLLK